MIATRATVTRITAYDRCKPGRSPSAHLFPAYSLSNFRAIVGSHDAPGRIAEGQPQLVPGDPMLRLSPAIIARSAPFDALP